MQQSNWILETWQYGDASSHCYCSHYAFISDNEDNKFGKTIIYFTKACFLTVYLSPCVHGNLYFFKSSPLRFRYYRCDEENSDCTHTRIEEKGTWNQSNMWNLIDGVELPCTVTVYFGPVWVMEFHMRFHPIGNSKSLSQILSTKAFFWLLEFAIMKRQFFWIFHISNSKCSIEK